jgi:hypothetical protein
MMSACPLKLPRKLRSGGSRFQASPGKKICEILISTEKNRVQWYVPVIPAMAENLKQEDHGPGQPGQKARTYYQNYQAKRAGDVAQVVECIPHKYEALSSNCKTFKWILGVKAFYTSSVLLT